MEFNIVTIVLICVAAAYFIIEQVLRTSRLGKFALLLRSDKYDEALDLLETPGSKWLFPPYNREYMKLNAYLMNDDEKSAAKQFDLLFSMRPSKKQRADLVVKAYRYYMEHERYKDAKPLLEEIEKTADKSVADESRLMWDIFAESDYSHIDEMEVQYEKAKSAQERMRLALLIATQYENAKRKPKVEEWRRKAEGAARELEENARHAAEKGAKDDPKDTGRR